MIREANLNDMVGIFELGKQINENYKNLYNVEKEITSKNNIYYLYELNNKIIGFVNIIKLVDELEIVNIIVDKENRKQKIGSKLLKYLFENHSEKCFLEVSSENIIAQKLYENFGFKVINTRKGYYNGIDAYIMMRK